MKRAGFTLIELLIVVAIIAILAAIAVPNFLEAQARSKISRVMADMRSVSVAINAYEVDNDKLPMFSNQIIYIGYLMVDNGNTKYLGTLLTSPVAYITSIPMDGYNTAMALRSDWKQPSNYAYSYVVTVQQLGTNNSAMDGWMREMSVLGALFPVKLQWALESCGPDLTWWSGYSGGSNNQRIPHRFLYDPTNGTVSQGQLVLSDYGWISPRN